MNGRLIVFSAPSGAGKTTVIRHLLESDLPLEFSISATSRAMRGGEKDGKDYYFLSLDVFKKKIAENSFLEWEEVYQNKFYGTLLSEIDRIWAKGNHVLFDVDVFGAANIKKKYPQQSLSIFLMPPSLEILKQRLLERGTETEESFNERREKAEYELSFANQFDKIIINNDLEDAQRETYKTVKDFLMKSL